MTKPPAGTASAPVTRRQVHTLPGLTIEKAPLSSRPLSPLRGKLRLRKAQKLPQATLVLSNEAGPPTRLPNVRVSAQNLLGVHSLLGLSPGPKTARTVIPLSVSMFLECRKAEHSTLSTKTEALLQELRAGFLASLTLPLTAV